MEVESVGRDNKPSGAAVVFLQSVCMFNTARAVYYISVEGRDVRYGVADV